MTSCNDNVFDCFDKLNSKVTLLLGNDEWKGAVFEAFERIGEVDDGGYGLQIAVDNKDSKLLKPLFLECL